MFGFFLFAVLFVALCLFTAEPAPQVVEAVQVVDDLPTLEELLAEAEALIAKPLPPRTAALVAQAAAVAAPVAIARVEVEPVAAIDYAAMTSAQLRKECSKATPRIAWRNAHGKGKHLRKEEMLRALA